MSNILILAFLFFAGCLIGWGIEVIFRRFEPNNKARKWINPGFLIGPYLPLYGFGLCTLYLLAGLEKFIHTDNTALQKFILFLLMAIAMTVIELIPGEIFIVKMHVKLWDYTGNKFNYKGIICPLYSLIWAALGAVYYFFIHPYILDALNWLANNLAFSFFIGFFYGVFAIDLFYSLKLAEKIKTFAEENDMVIRYEEFKRHIRESSEERKEKYRFMLSMGSGARLGEHLKKYRDKQREEQRGHRLNDFISKIKKSDT